MAKLCTMVRGSFKSVCTPNLIKNNSKCVSSFPFFESNNTCVTHFHSQCSDPVQIGDMT